MPEWVKRANPRLGFENMPIWECSSCKSGFTFHPDYEFCPRCGAYMKEGADNA